MIKKFQQGGTTNIAIGSPKPYTHITPGINIPTGAFTNSPIEINTTSIFDQMDKMERLNLDREKLKFQYEELKYKQGRDFMEFASDMFKTVQSSAQTISGLGGFSSMERYTPIFKSYNERKSKAMENFIRQFQTRDPNSLMNAQMEMMQVETDPAYLQALSEIGVMEKVAEQKLKNPSVTNTKTFMDLIGFASDPNADWGQFLPGVMNEFADDTKQTDIQKTLDSYLDNLITTTKGTKTETGQPTILPSGLVSKNFGHSIATAEQIENGLAGIFTSSAGYKNYLESQGVNPENIDDVRNFLRPTAQAYHDILKMSFKPITETSGTIQKGIEVNPDGSVDEKPEVDASGNKKMSEAEKKQQSRMKYFISMYPGVDIDEFINNKIIEGAEDKWFSEISTYLSQKGITGKGGSGVGDASGLQKINIKTLDELGIAFDPESTKLVKGKDGKNYLITNELEVINHIDDIWKDSAKRSNLWDREVKKLTGVSTEEWNKWPGFDDNAAVYTIEDSTPGKAVSGKFDSGVPVDIQKSGLPIRGSHVTGFVSSDLINQLSGVLDEEGLVVSSGSDGKHTNEAQAAHGTSVDVNFKERTTDDTVKRIPEVMDRLRRRGLRPVYEVKTQAEKDRIMKLNPEIKDSDIEVVSWASDNHFSVYCDYCSQVDAKGKQKSVQGTQSTAIEAAKDLPPTSLSEIIGE